MKKEKTTPGGKLAAPGWKTLLRRTVLLVLAAVAIGLGCTPPREKQMLEPPAPTPAPAADRRSVRESAYGRDLAALQELAENPSIEEETRTQAARRMEQMIREHQAELAIEEALVQAGYRPELVLMQNNALTIMLDGEMSSGVSASILALCAAHAGVGAEHVRIMGK